MQRRGGTRKKLLKGKENGKSHLLERTVCLCGHFLGDKVLSGETEFAEKG